MGGNPSLVMFPFPFSVFFLVNFSSLILFCVVLVVIFRFLEVLKLVLRQEKWDDHFRGVLSFPSCFSCCISLREMLCSSLRGQIVVESALDFFNILCYTCLCLCCVSHMSWFGS